MFHQSFPPRPVYFPHNIKLEKPDCLAYPVRQQTVGMYCGKGNPPFPSSLPNTLDQAIAAGLLRIHLIECCHKCRSHIVQSHLPSKQAERGHCANSWCTMWKATYIP